MSELPSFSAENAPCARRAKQRRKRHAGEVADGFLARGLDVQQIDIRAGRPQRHVGDLLGIGREPRREHQVGAVGQIAGVGAVLIHDRQAPDAVGAGPALGYEDDAGVEIAGRAGQLLIDGVGDLVADSAPVLRRGGELQAQQLLAGIGVPQAEVGGQSAVRVAGYLAGDQGLGADRLPVVEHRLNVDVAGRRLEGRRIERAEEARAGEVGADHAGDLSPDRRAAERGNGDRQGLADALVDVDDDVRPRRRRERHEHHDDQPR